MKKKVNYYKIGALVLMMVEIGIAIFTSKETLQDLNIWRIYMLCITFIPINLMYICTKQPRKVVKRAKISKK